MAGVRGAVVRGASVPAVRVPVGQVPVRASCASLPFAAACLCCFACSFQSQADQPTISAPACGLHGQQHHTPRTSGQ